MPLATVGNIIYKDISGKGQLGAADVVKLGHISPSWNLGMTNRFYYKQFDLAVSMYAKLGMYPYMFYASRKGEGIRGPVEVKACACVSAGKSRLHATVVDCDRLWRRNGDVTIQAPHS